MVKAQKEEEVVVEEEVKEEEVVKATGAVSVYSSSGLFVREYSKEVHGAEYKKLAEMYAVKIKGTVK